MIFALTMSLVLAGGPRILFVGNSHTSTGDVPGTVAKLLQGEKEFAGLEVVYHGVPILNSWRISGAEAVENGSFTHAVLQGAEISSSHKYTYSQKEGIELAKSLRDKGAKVFFVCEWPRRGWDETEYIEKIYEEMAKESGAKLIRVGRVWDSARAELEGIDLWQPDGNHTGALGAYLSARTIAWHLGGRTLDYVPKEADGKFVKAVDSGIAKLKD